MRAGRGYTTLKGKEEHKMRYLSIIFFCLIILVGCIGPPVRDAAKVDMDLPVGRIEGNQFVGIRYPFRVTAPANWTVAMEHPKFMEALGYDKQGLKESQIFVFNPDTQSNLQIELRPASPFAKFDQRIIEEMVTGISEDFAIDVNRQYGTRISFSRTVPISLKGVQYAAEKHGTFAVEGMIRHQGWIYAFAEPYQIFILYMIILEKGGARNKDLEDLRSILESFEVFSKK